MHINTKLRLESLSQVPFKYLGAALAMRTLNKARALTNKRFTWSITDVGNSVCPEADFRNYYDALDIRTILGEFIKEKVQTACELGCGYGRITPVLSEFAHSTVGYEREPALRDIAKHYVRGINFEAINSLTDIGAREKKFDLIMIFTVLQHCTTEHAQNVIDAMKKAVKPGGYILIEESTGVERHQVIGSAKDGTKFISHPRTLQFYEDEMKPAALLKAIPRQGEKSIIGDPGSLMLFQVQ